MAPEQHILNEFADLLDRVGTPAPTFGMPELHDVCSWIGPIEPLLYARLLSALISADPRPETITACASAVAAVDRWQELVLDLLAAAAPGAPAIGVLREVLQAREVPHPLAAMDQAPRIVTMVPDAVSQPEGLFVSTQHRLTCGSQWLLLATADPIGQIATAFSIEQSEGVLLTGLPVGWCAPDQVVCPAFFLLSVETREE